MTQCEKILDYMREFGGITTLEAFSDLGITRLASRIHDLGNMGYDISRETIKGVNRYGDTVHYTRYYLKS